MRARTRKGAGRYRLAEAAARELMNILGSCDINDFRLWAWYCYHHDIGILFDRAYALASAAKGERLRNPVTAFQRWLSRTYGKEAT